MAKMPDWTTQNEYDVRFEWGLSGVEALAPVSDVVIIVDVLSFTTSVDIVVGQGGTVYPYRAEPEKLPAFAESVGALYAQPGRTHQAGLSLAPSSLTAAPPGTRIVLPSPNGSTLSLTTGETPTFAGCLRNGEAVAAAAQRVGRRISVIAAGERWPGGLLRPALEDLLGAGAIISSLPGSRSPEAELAVAGFLHARASLLDTLLRCGSGQELVGRGFAEDVHLAAELNLSHAAPFLVDGAYQPSS